MRVVSGKLKGRKLRAPLGDIARPTGDRVKEAMFSMLGQSLSEKLVLDLFAGSGGLGIEAVSRGAKYVVFVDCRRASIETIAANLGGAGADCTSVWLEDWRQGLARYGQQFNLVDWVFVDPPYALNLWEPVLTQIAKIGLFVREGIVCEHPKTTELPEVVGPFHTYKRKIYGSVALTFYRTIQERCEVRENNH